MTGDDIRGHIAWLGLWCERLLVLAERHERHYPMTALTLRDAAAQHARTAQTWAEDLHIGRAG